MKHERINNHESESDEVVGERQRDREREKTTGREKREEEEIQLLFKNV